MTIAEVEAAAKRLKRHAELEASLIGVTSEAKRREIRSSSPFWDSDLMRVSKMLMEEDQDLVVDYAIESLGIKTETP